MNIRLIVFQVFLDHWSIVVHVNDSFLEPDRFIRFQSSRCYYLVFHWQLLKCGATTCWRNFANGNWKWSSRKGVLGLPSFSRVGAWVLRSLNIEWTDCYVQNIRNCRDVSCTYSIYELKSTWKCRFKRK